MEKKEKEKKPLSVIDVLSGGFEIVVRQPWVLLIPIALDFFLWLGPQINAKPVFQQILALLNASMTSAPPETLQNLDQFKSALQTTGDRFNVFGFIALLSIGVPSLIGVEPPPDDLPHTVLFAVGDGAALLAWVMLFAVIGMFIGSVYLESIARGVRRDTAGARTFSPRVVTAYLNVILLLVLGIVAMMLFMVPFAFGATLVSLINPALGSFMVFAGSLLILWAALYLAFVIPAIFVSGANAPQAVLNSIAVFRSSFWSALGLIFLIYLIQMGFSIIWEQFLASTWGVTLGIVGNAFLGSGLIAAAMVFYRDRFASLTEAREQRKV